MREQQGGRRSARSAEATDDGGWNAIMQEVDLAHYLRVLRKRRWPITLFTAAVTGIAAYYALTATPIYRATSTLLIEPQRAANISSIEELVGVESENQDYYQTQFELLRSRRLALRVMDRLDLWSVPEFDFGPSVPTAGRSSPTAETGVASGLLAGIGGFLRRVGIVDDDVGSDASGAPSIVVEGTTADPAPDNVRDVSAMRADIAGDGDLSEAEIQREYVLSSFMGRLTIDPVSGTKLVRIGFESPDPVLAARIANAVGEEYITSYLDAKIELTSKAARWLGERLATLKTTLDGSENRLIAFKQENGLVDVNGSVGRLNEQELLLATTELTQARSELAGAADLFREAQALRGDVELLATLPSVQSDPLVQRAKIDLGQAQRELDELLNRYGERHPRVIDVKSRLDSLNTALAGHVDRVVGAIAKDYQLLQQRVRSIEAKLDTGKQAIQAIGTKKFELDALEREVATNREIYGTFFNRMSEARSADGLEAANARVADLAVPPVAPFKPKTTLIIALALLASLVLSMLMAFLYEHMDDSFKSTDDVERKLGLKLLGILPLVKGGRFSKRRTTPLDPRELVDRDSRFGESMNTIRTAIVVSEAARPHRVIVVTSSVPGEGKSTTAINLAYAFAQMERVLLIDCDLRRPSIGKAAGLERDGAGVSSLISGRSSADESIRKGAFDGAFDLLPSGPSTEQPLELLSSSRFEQILEQLAGHYDRVIIDSAPAQAVSDALVLSKMADAVIYAIRSGETAFELARRGIQRLRQAGAPIIGTVVTQVDIDRLEAYGGDYHYQGYYDYYGYQDKRSARPAAVQLTRDELRRMRTDNRAVDLGLTRRDDARSDADAGDMGMNDWLAARQRKDPSSARAEPYRQNSSRFSDDLDIL